MRFLDRRSWPRAQQAYSRLPSHEQRWSSLC